MLKSFSFSKIVSFMAMWKTQVGPDRQQIGTGYKTKKFLKKLLPGTVDIKHESTET
jgi:hypothetical protein